MTSTETGIVPPVAFSPEHEFYAGWVRDFAGPYASGYLARALKDEFPWDVAREMAEVGLLGLGTPEEYGGQGPIGEGLTKVHLGIAHEELAYADFYLSQVAYTCNLIGPLLSRFLPAEVAREWVPEVVQGRRLVAVGLTEPESGSDAMAMRMTARRAPGGWILNGEKTSITFAPHAAGMVTFAKVEEGPFPQITAFLVELDAPGVSMQRFPDPGWKPLGRSGVFLDDVFVPDNMVIGGIGDGFRLVMREFDYTRSVIGLMSTGVARKALDLTVQYARERTAFGKAIGHYQGVSFPIAEDATRLEAARWLTYRALSLSDMEKPYTKEAAMVKWYATDVALIAIRNCVIAHGHNGYSEDYPFQSMLRDVSGLEIGEGTPQIQKLVISRALLGSEFR